MSNPHHPNQSKQRLSQRLILSGLMLSVFGTDQWIKNTMQAIIQPHQSIPVIPDMLQWTLTYNTGAAFSLFNTHPELLTIITGVILLLLLGFSLIKALSTPEAFCFGFILGGAAGNLYDRITLGKVVDFIDVVIINYPVFNVADSFIFIGVVGLVWQQLFNPKTTQGVSPS